MVNSNGGVRIGIKEIQRVRAISYRHARLYMQKMRAYLKKEPHNDVSIGDFSIYSGISKQEIIDCLKRNK